MPEAEQKEVEVTPSAITLLLKLSPDPDEKSEIWDALQDLKTGATQGEQLFSTGSYIARLYHVNRLGRLYFVRVGRFTLVYTSNGKIIVVAFHQLG